MQDSTIKNSEVEGCLAERVGELRFGELSKPASAEWTYVFRLAQPPSQERGKRRADKKKRKKQKEAEDDEPGIVVEPSSTGFIDPDKIHDVVHSGYRLFARCYRDGVERNLDLGGTIRFRFVIDASGRVTRVLDGESDLTDRRVVDCVAETFYALEFPPARGDVHVFYRLALE